MGKVNSNDGAVVEGDHSVVERCSSSWVDIGIDMTTKSRLFLDQRHGLPHFLQSDCGISATGSPTNDANVTFNNLHEAERRILVTNYNGSNDS